MATDSPLTPQNFSIPAGDAADLNFDINPDSGVSLLGANLVWCAYRQQYGLASGDPIIKKALDHGLQITDPDLLKFQVTMRRVDTVDLDPGNYSWEATVIDTDDNYVTVALGIMTVTPTVNRDFTAEEIP